MGRKHPSFGIIVPALTRKVELTVTEELSIGYVFWRASTGAVVKKLKKYFFSREPSAPRKGEKGDKKEKGDILIFEKGHILIFEVCPAGG